MQKRIKQENLNIDRTDVRLTSDYIHIYIYISVGSAGSASAYKKS